MKKKISIGQIVLHTIFILLSLTYILPFILVISISISSESAIREFGYTILPKVIDFEAYRQIFQNPSRLLDSYVVTIFFSAVTKDMPSAS